MQLPGEALLIEMLNLLFVKGIGSIAKVYYEPWKDKRLAIGGIRNNLAIEKEKVLAKKDLDIIYQNIDELDSDMLRISNTKATHDTPEGDIHSIIERAVHQSLNKNHLKEEVSIAKAIYHASIVLLNDEKQNADNEDIIDEDWLFSWREYASKVTSDQMHIIWGNVLAQEFTSPGKYSLRTLEFIKTLSKKEASIIEKFAPFLSYSGLIYRGHYEDGDPLATEDLLNCFSLKLEDLRMLGELGILADVSVMGNIVTLNNLSEIKEHLLSIIFIDDKNKIHIESDKIKSLVKIAYFPLTSLGREIISLVSHEKNRLYIEWLAAAFENDFKVSVIHRNKDQYEVKANYQMEQ